MIHRPLPLRATDNPRMFYMRYRLASCLLLYLLLQACTPHLGDSEAALADVRSACLSTGDSITCSSVSFDVTEEGSVRQAFGALRDEGVVPNALFNNAGYQGVFANTADYPVIDFRHVMEVNVTGAFTVLRVWASTLRGRRR